VKFIYEHDEEDDFIEIQLSEGELKRLMHDTPIECSEPACLNTRRLTNVYIRRMPDAVDQEQKQESDGEEYSGTRGSRAQKELKRSHSSGCCKKSSS